MPFNREIDYSHQEILPSQFEYNAREWYNACATLVGKLATWLSPTLIDFFSQESSSIKVGLLGNPHRGKTTLAKSWYTMSTIIGIPSHFQDLDSYAGHLVMPLRRTDISQNEANALNLAFNQITSGLVFADFPGRVDNPDHPQRLAMLHYAVILYDPEFETPDRWVHLCQESNPDLKVYTLKSVIERKTGMQPMQSVVVALDKDNAMTFDRLVSLCDLFMSILRELRVFKFNPDITMTDAEKDELSTLKAKFGLMTTGPNDTSTKYRRQSN